jgi:hypothetical protein
MIGGLAVPARITHSGRGPLIVDRLARAWGRTGNETAGWITWFEMDHPWPLLATSVAPGGQQPS